MASLPILRQYLADAERVLAEAQEYLREIQGELNAGDVPSAENVDGLYRRIHTLKGMSGLVDGGEPIVMSLQAVESLLTRQTIESSAQEAQKWVGFASEALSRTQKTLTELKRNWFQSTEPVEWKRSPLGILVRVQSSEKVSEKYWLSRETVRRVLGPWELPLGNSICIEEGWVPLHGKGDYGLLVRSSQGLWILRVQHILALASEKKAKEAHALVLDPDVLFRAFSEQGHADTAA